MASNSAPYVSMANAIRSVIHKPKPVPEPKDPVDPSADERELDVQHAKMVSAGVAARSHKSQIKSIIQDD